MKEINDYHQTFKEWVRETVDLIEWARRRYKIDRNEKGYKEIRENDPAFLRFSLLAQLRLVKKFRAIQAIAYRIVRLVSVDLDHSAYDCDFDRVQGFHVKAFVEILSPITLITSLSLGSLRNATLFGTIFVRS